VLRMTWKETDQPQSQHKRVAAHDITPCRRPTISPNDHPSFKLDSHDGCLYVSCVDQKSGIRQIIALLPTITLPAGLEADRSNLRYEDRGIARLTPKLTSPFFNAMISTLLMFAILFRLSPCRLIQCNDMYACPIDNV